jgi:hypothetical protein
MQNNILQQPNQLRIKQRSMERLHSSRHLFNILTIRQCMRNNLFNHLLSEWVIFLKNRCPKLQISSFNQVNGLLLKESLSVGKIN